jgi:hypothetical protein
MGDLKSPMPAGPQSSVAALRSSDDNAMIEAYLTDAGYKRMGPAAADPTKHQPTPRGYSRVRSGVQENATKTAAAVPGACALCGTTDHASHNFRRCARCKVVDYCSGEKMCV